MNIFHNGSLVTDKCVQQFCSKFFCGALNAAFNIQNNFSPRDGISNHMER